MQARRMLHQQRDVQQQAHPAALALQCWLPSINVLQWHAAGASSRGWQAALWLAAPLWRCAHGADVLPCCLLLPCRSRRRWPRWMRPRRSRCRPMAPPTSATPTWPGCGRGACALSCMPAAACGWCWTCTFLDASGRISLICARGSSALGCGAAFGASAVAGEGSWLFPVLLQLAHGW